jgi:hypothetical protein
MIRAVVDASAFQIGQQYLAENRVRIVEAGDTQISSAVIGNSGLYEQTIRLKDGLLISRCSCSLPEEHMCRHCIAVLLEYHRWSQPRQPRKTKEFKEDKWRAPSTEQANSKTPTAQASSADVKLSEVMLFVEWLQPAMQAIEKSQPVPEPPQLGTGEVSAWIQTIRNLNECRRESEDVRANLEADIRDREAYVGSLTQQLQASIAEAKAAQAASQDLQNDAALYKGLLAKVTELTADVTRCDDQVKSMAGEILSKGAQLDKLAGSFKELAEALKSITKQLPPR